MMDLKEALVKLKQKNNEKKEVKKMIQAELNRNQEYVRAVDEVKAAKNKLNAVENQINADANLDLLRQHDSLKAEVDSLKDLVSDIALSLVTGGQTAVVEDDNGVKYEPKFSAKFTKK